MIDKISDVTKNINSVINKASETAKKTVKSKSKNNKRKKTTTAEKQIINASLRLRSSENLKNNPLMRYVNGNVEKAYDGMQILNNYDYDKPLKYEKLPDGDIRLTDSNEILNAAKAYNAAQDIKYYYDFVGNKRKTDPYYAMGYDELRQKKAEASETYLSGGMTWEEYNNISFDLTSRMAKVANRKQLEELHSEVKDINKGFENTKNYKNTPTTLMITNGKNITTAKEFYESLGGSITERMNVYKLEDDAAKVTNKYRNMADKSGVTGEYVPTKEYKTYIFGPNSTEDETYDMVNLYHSKKISKANIMPDLRGGREYLWMYLTPDEVVEYNRAFKMGKGKEFLSAMNPTLEMRQTKQEELENYEYGQKHPILGGIKSLGERIFYSPQAFIDDGIDWLTTGKINTYDSSSRIIRNANARIAGGAEYMRQKYGDGAAVIYGGSISILENVANLYLGKGVGKAFGLGSKGVSNVVAGNMFTSAASSTMISIADRGGTTEQILIGGLASGFAELVFEKYSVGKILDASDGVRTYRQILKNMPINAVTNLQEEAATDIANIWLDSAIMGQQSESKILERKYIAQGMSIEEARGNVFLNNIARVAEAGVIGGFAGVTMGAMSDFEAYRYNINILGNPADVTRIVDIGLEVDNELAKTVNEILEKGGKIKTEDRSALVESVVNDSITKDATLPGVVKVIGAIEGRNSDYYTSDEAVDTANAVLKMTNGTATKADYALIERSEGARTVILSAEGTKAWDSLKAEADKRMQNAEKIPSPPEAALSPLGKGRSEVRSEATPVNTEFTEVKGMSFGDILTDKSKVKSATISDGEIYSNGKKVTIDNTSKVAGYVVLDEESYNFRKVNKKGYDVIQTMAKDLEKIVQYVDGLTDSEGKALDGIITSEGIFINTQSKNPTRWAATHEFSHRMKQTGGKMWQRYQDYVISHLKETGKYEERYNLKKGTYAESEIDEEIAADYIGVMFEDVNELSKFIRKNRRDAFGIRNAYYKVLDKLGLLDEKKKAQAMWARAYREAMKNVKEGTAEYEDGAKFKIQEIVGENGSYGIGVYLDSDILTKLSESERITAVKNHIKSLGGSEFVAYDNGKPVRIRIAKYSNKYTNKNGAKIRVNNDLTSYLNNKVKQEAIVLVDELVATSTYDFSEKSKYSHGWVDNYGKNDWDYWKVFVQEKNKTVWEVTLNIANSKNGEKILYDIYPIKMVEEAGTSAITTTNINVPQNEPNVNAKKSVSGTRVEEETKDLLAVHNMNEKQLLDALERKQIAAPSVAVSNKAHTEFGEISVVFDKDTIDPEKNAENKLFGSDAWTPTQTELKKNPVFDNTAVSETIRGIENSIGDGYSELFDFSENEFKKIIAEADGSVYTALADNLGMQTAFALENKLVTQIPKDNTGKINAEKLSEKIEVKLDVDANWRAYKKWLLNISDKIIKTYDKASNEDIINNIKAQPKTAKPFKLGVNGELTVPAVEYSSIEEYRQNKSRLSENAEEETKEVGKSFIEWAKSVQTKTGVPIRNIVKTINNSFSKRYSAEEIAKSFNDLGIKITKSKAMALQGLYKKAVELPTLYFEAKALRAVGLEEIAMVVIPNTASKELKAKLTELNVPYKEYATGDKNSRAETVNSVDNVKFSVAGTRLEDNLSSEDKSDYNQFLNDNGGGLHTFRPAKEEGWLSQQWITNRSEGNEEIAKSLNKISDIISNDFGVPINNRSFSDENVAGSFNLTAEAIHTRAKNDIITLSHEVGHLLDKKLKLQKIDGIDKLTENFDRTLAALGYGENSKKAEAVGEFVRMYLTNKEVAKAFCSEYFEAFENAIEKSDYKKAVEKLSGAVNAYLSATTSERIDLAISDKTKEKSIRNNLAEKKNKFPELWNKFQYEFVDRYYAIGRAQGKVYAKNPEGKYDAHTLATNSLNSAARSAYILTKSFVTIEGEEIGKSFIDCLEPIANKKAGIRKKNISELNRYLVLKHALEWIDPKTEGAHKKRVFADESLENPEVLKVEIEKIEKDLPGVKEAAENIYQYIRNLKKYWGIDAGLMTQELSDKLDKMYPNYVPFFREGDKKTITGARTNLANQRAPILEASGGEGMIVNPLESIIGLTNKYVKTASRNMAMQAIAHMADNVGGTGFIIERASGEQQSALEKNETLEEKTDAPEASPEELRSITTEEDVWTKETKSGKGFASVLINGEKVWYQINDEQLFKAVADMEPKKLNAFLRGCNVFLNLKRSLITSNNPLFAGTNAVRDAITAYNNIDINNPFSYLKAYYTALYHVIRKNPNYKRWCAMGGGHSSELSANMDAVKRELGKAMRNPKAKAFSWIIHPIQTIASINDAVESTPRLMAFEHEMKKSGDVHKAINKADDITTNFKRGGRTAKNLNNVFMFSNAAIQGLDRTIRSFTKNETEHGLRNRIIKYSVVAMLATVFQMAINRRDEETEEDYKNLSSYMKRSNYVISIGGGKFLRIPTAREQDMLRVIIADAVNYAFGDKEAFDGLLGFAVDTLWPWYVELPQNTDGKSMLDIMTEMFINTARNTPFGFLTDFAANYDFTGKPIVSSKYDDVPRKEQYDERTSKLAIWLGKLTNESPLKIDYIINSNFGILGTINKSLFPMDKSQKDKSIGFISRWVADSYYSTDVLDKVYSKNEAAKMKFQGDGSGKNLAEYKKTSMAADFITQYNKAVKNLPEEEKRDARKRLLDIINNWRNGKSASEEELIRLYDATGEDMFITAPKLSISTTTGKRDMTADEYVELVEKYTAGYEALFAEVIANEKYKNADDYTKVELLKDADSYALNSAKAEIFPDFEMPKWQAEIFEGKEAASETFFGRVEADAFTSAKKEWSNTNFNIDESKYSEAEISSMNEFEESAAAFYTSHEMNIPYEEGKYRRVQVYHDYLKDVMSLEEFAGIKAYANKVASTMGEGSTNSMSSKELQAYLNSLGYDQKTKGALFEAIADKGWKNPYSGGKVGDGTRFPVITHSPVEGEKSDVKAPLSEEKVENLSPQTKLPGGYTGGGSVKPTGKKVNRTNIAPVSQTKNDVTVNYNPSKYNARETETIKKVQDDARSYYNSPRLSSYNNNPLRHMYVFETKLSSRISLDDYADIRARAMNFKDNFTIEGLEEFIEGLSYDEETKSALFEAIGEEDWENPFEEEKTE